MLSIFFKRIFLAIPVLFAVASITFFLIKLAPGGPFDADRAVSPQVLKNLNEAYNCYSKIVDSYKDSSEYQISIKNKSRLEGLI